MEKSFSERVADAINAVKSLSPEEANKFKLIDPNTLFVDPRDEEDIRSTTGIIPGALNVPLNQISAESTDNYPSLLQSRSRTIITCCQGGPMGAIAAHELKQRGYENVYYIEGGTQNWLDAGYATAR